MVLKDDIYKWLVEENLFKQELMDNNANFHFTIEYPEKNIMDVIQPKGKNDIIVIGCATKVAPEHLQLMQQESDDVREEFLWDVKFSLNNFLLNFDIKTDYNLLTQFIITDDLYADSISKHNLIKTIQKLFKAKLNCVWLIEKTFGTTSPQNIHPDNENSMFV